VRLWRRPKRSKDVQTHQEPGPLLGLGILLFFSTLPMFSEMSISLNAVISLLFIYRLALLRYPQLPSNRFLLFLLTLGGTALVIAHFHTVFGYQAGMSLFAMMMALKFAETRNERDFYIVWIIGLFYLVAQFLINQSMYLALYFLLLVIGLFMVLLRFNRGCPAPLSELAGFVGLTLLQSVPLVIILFLLFPRLDNPLWHLDLPDNKTGITGLSSQMEPGSINRLIHSEEPVLRAEFSGKQPERNQLYWRGPVLWRTDGKRWVSNPPIDEDRQPTPLLFADDKLTYRLIVEPHGKKWVLPLDLPAAAPARTDLSIDHQLIFHQAINQRTQFTLTSFTRYKTGELIPEERLAGLQVPTNFTPRTLALTNQWKTASSEPADIVNFALKMFNQDTFIYTLAPPRLSDNPLDSFLFETKAGFCEHYASAFTLLMRSAGIPSRVVTGYLGGEYNDLGKYYIVRQSDAHAWSEVWLENSGWSRVDPTAAVAPERIQSSIVSESGNRGNRITFRVSENGIFGRLFRNVRFSLDTLNMNWHIWILNYNNSKQAGMLEWLGLDYVGRYAINLAMLIICLSIMFILWIFARRIPLRTEDKVTRLYSHFCSRLQRIGISRRPHEGPVDFADRAAKLHPELESEIRQITNLYTQIKYRGINSLVYRRQFQQQVHQFRPVK